MRSMYIISSFNKPSSYYLIRPCVLVHVCVIPDRRLATMLLYMLLLHTIDQLSYAVYKNHQYPCTGSPLQPLGIGIPDMVLIICLLCRILVAPQNSLLMVPVDLISSRENLVSRTYCIIIAKWNNPRFCQQFSMLNAILFEYTSISIYTGEYPSACYLLLFIVVADLGDGLCSRAHLYYFPGL